MRTTRSVSKSLAESVAPSTKEATRPTKLSPPKTDDGHYITVNGCKWRATDPMVPDKALAEIKHFLAKGRSGARRQNRDDSEKLRLSRKATGLAKLGLGERGKPEWWNDTDEGRKERWENALTQLRGLYSDNNNDPS
ncbi:hypothetical protein QBC36DRAFT_328576 [Triangularia setosa]|uniref:Uncharacterized protein n=1 Tax=Triangularia setosa TaxID=2587417 RepID=A0AAN6W7S9_9PEZI|nr:hypothetical protein QBC36DRAFT_328576 [Podospora setosa]